MKSSIGLILKVAAAAVLLSLVLRSCAPMLGGQHRLVGQAAPDFTLPTVNGPERNITAFRDGQPALILFWTTWCPYCRSELAELTRQRDEFERKGIRIILVDVKESRQDVLQYVQAQGVPFDVFWDEKGTVAQVYRIVGFPTFFFVGAEGDIRAVEHQLPEDLETLLLGSPAP